MVRKWLVLEEATKPTLYSGMGTLRWHTRVAANWMVMRLWEVVSVTFAIPS
jgi:hypothetical protein